jgi:SulP family sulfate permease
MLRQPLDAARAYDGEKLRADLGAGLTVAVIAIPQAMAYATIAGVPPQYGLFTLLAQAAIGSLLSSQPLLAVGPTNTQSLLVGAIVTRAIVVLGGPAELDPAALYLRLTIGLALVKGLLQVGMAALGLGGLVRYVSGSVIVGFTGGAGILIATGQVAAFLGIPAARAGALWPGVVGDAERVLPRLAEMRGAALGVGVASLAAILIARRVSRRMPGPLLALLIGVGAVAGLGLGSADLSLVPDFAGALPAPSLPALSLVEAQALLGGGLVLALLGMLEAYSIGRTLALRSGMPVSADQELLSQGLTNAISSLFGGFPGSGSFGRSGLNYSAGARTLYAGVFSAAFVALALLALAPAARFVPLSSLAAVLFVVAYELLDWREIARLRRASPPDFQVCIATLVATLLIPLTYAVAVGIALNLALYLRQASRLKVAEMVQGDGGIFHEHPLRDEAGERSVVLLQLEGDLFFGVADELEDRLTRLAQGSVRVVVMRLKRTHSIDATVLGVLERFASALRERGRFLLLCGLRPEVSSQLHAFGLGALLGEENLFLARAGIFASTRLALDRARQLIGTGLDTAELAESELADEPVAYEI